jgi:hypothetical protein
MKMFCTAVKQSALKSQHQTHGSVSHNTQGLASSLQNSWQQSADMFNVLLRERYLASHRQQLVL